MKAQRWQGLDRSIQRITHRRIPGRARQIASQPGGRRGSVRIIRWAVTLPETEHRASVARQDGRAGRLGRHGVTLIGSAGRDMSWLRLITALCDHGSLPPDLWADACRSEHVKGFRCPACGGSSGYAIRGDAVRATTGYVLSCGSRCKPRDATTALGVTWPDFRPLQDRRN